MTDRPNSFPGGAPAGNDGGGKCSTVFTPSGKPKRKAIPAHVKVSVAIAQAGAYGIQCPLCEQPLMHHHPRILEHLVPRATRIALGLDPDAQDILAFVHAECAARKTNGNAATSASGDKHKIAKAKRLAKAQEVHKAVLAGTHKRPPSRIKSRGFAKVHRPLRWRDV